MRELIPTLRNGIGQTREPPLHLFENKIDSQNMIVNANYFIKI